MNDARIIRGARPPERSRQEVRETRRPHDGVLEEKPRAEPAGRRRRILFVDDEIRILEGIQRLLRPIREWDVVACDSGAKALALLAGQSFDVVISDMRMPVMDGAELLQAVMQRHPQVARIILSGQADRASILRSLGATHHYLAKPCDPQRLREAVARACALRDVLHDEPLQRLVAGFATVPGLPEVCQRLRAELGKDPPSPEAIGAIVAPDPSLVAELLVLAGSSRWGTGRPTDAPAEAVRVLGPGAVAGLALGAHTFAALSGAVSGGSTGRRPWERCVQVAFLARLVGSALKFAPAAADLAFTAGLMQDCGALLLAANRPAEFAAALSDPAHTDALTAERAHCATDHAAAGAYLLGLWGLPEPVVEAVAFHHRPATAPITGASPLVAAHVAGALIDETAGGAGAIALDPGVVRRFNLGGLLDEWRRARDR